MTPKFSRLETNVTLVGYGLLNPCHVHYLLLPVKFCNHEAYLRPKGHYVWTAQMWLKSFVPLCHFNFKYNQAKKIHWACTTPPHVKTSQPSNRLDSRGRMQKMGQAKADVAGHVHGRHESNGYQWQWHSWWNQKCCQRPCSMETTRRPVSQQGQEDLSLSLSNVLCMFLPGCMECRRGLAMRILSVCLSVRPSVCHTRVLWQNGRKICPDLYTIWKNI